MSAELQADIRYLRQRGFDAKAGAVGDRLRVGTRWLTEDQVRAMAARERELDNGVESATTINRDDECRGVVWQRAAGAEPSPVAGSRPAASRDVRVMPERHAGSNPAGTRSRSRSSTTVERDLCDEIIGLVAARVDDAEDIAGLLIADAVRCVHAASILVATLPEARSRAAVVRELKRFLPEIVEQRAGELHHKPTG